MKKITFLLLIIVSIAYSQAKKTIVPTSGTIVFERRELITDEAIYKKSQEELASKMIDYQIKNELIKNPKITDTAIINQLKEQLVMAIANENLYEDVAYRDENYIKYHQEFKNNQVINYTTSFEELLNDYLVINTKTQLTKTIANDSITVLSENQPYKYSTAEILEIKEYKEETKTINGYICFKVIMQYKSNEIEEDAELNNFMQQFIQKKELWVTTKIKCNYHPVINQKQILSKYYPLEIIESSEAHEGFITKYTIEKMDIK